jgi:Concanavalin A-like lectin/glucanases superfamily
MFRSIFTMLAVLLVMTPTLAQTCVPAPYGITHWYPGEGNAIDLMGNNNGVIAGTVTFGPGKVNQAFQFHGNQNDGVNLGGVLGGDVPAFNFTATSSFSIEAWVNVATLPVPPPDDGYTIVSLNYSCTQATPAVEMLAIQGVTGKAIFMIRDANGNSVIVSSQAQVPTSTWVHLVGVRDASCSPKRVQLYMNGVEVASAIDTTAASLANVGPNMDYIGRRFTCTTNNPFNGAIDEVSIYNRALTACEISALSNANCAGKCSLGTCSAATCGC